MEVTVAARHCEIPDSLRLRAVQRIDRLRRFEPRLVGAEVVFETDHGVRRAEARVSVAGGAFIVANGSGSSHRAALDRLVDRLGRQLRRRRERRRDHQAKKLSEVSPPVPEGA